MNSQNTSPQTTNPENPRSGSGRGRGPRTVTAAEKAQAREVSLRRIGQPEEVGNLACYLISEDASYVNGQVIAADGGATTA